MDLLAQTVQMIVSRKMQIYEVDVDKIIKILKIIKMKILKIENGYCRQDLRAQICISASRQFINEV